MPKVTEQQLMPVKMFQSWMLGVGFISNAWCAIVIFKYKICPSQFTKYVIQNQFIFDAVICCLTIFSLWFRQRVFQVNSHLDAFSCYILSSQALFWTICSFINQNLVWTAVDRYLAVIYPTIYKVKKTYLIVAYVTQIIIISTPQCITISFLVTIQNHSCVWIAAHESWIFPFAALFHATTNYLIPIICFVFFYTKVFLKLKNMSHTSKGNEQFRKSTISFTIGCFINVILFIALLLMANVLFVMQSFALFSYNDSMMLQQISVFLVSINSCLNPFIYLIAMKKLRSNFFFCGKLCNKNKVEPTFRVSD